MAQYQELESFAQFGSDLDADTRTRLHLGERIVEVLKQDRNAPVPVGGQVGIIYAVINGYLNDVALDDIKDYQERLYEKLDHEHKDWMVRISQGSWTEEDEEELKGVLNRMNRK